MTSGPGIIYYNAEDAQYEMYRGVILGTSQRLQDLRNEFPNAAVAMSAFKQEEKEQGE